MVAAAQLSPSYVETTRIGGDVQFTGRHQVGESSGGRGWPLNFSAIPARLINLPALLALPFCPAASGLHSVESEVASQRALRDFSGETEAHRGEGLAQGSTTNLMPPVQKGPVYCLTQIPVPCSGLCWGLFHSYWARPMSLRLVPGGTSYGFRRLFIVHVKAFLEYEDSQSPHKPYLHFILQAYGLCPRRKC